MTFPPGSSSGDIPPPWHPFIPPFDPPGNPSPSTTPDSPEGSSADDDASTDERPDWWPDDLPWPTQPEEPVVIESPPPIHVGRDCRRTILITFHLATLLPTTCRRVTPAKPVLECRLSRRATRRLG